MKFEELTKEDQERFSQLKECVDNNNFDELEELLKNKSYQNLINVNYSKAGVTLFYTVCQENKFDVMDILFELENLEINRTTYNGSSPFSAAVLRGNERNKEAIDRLLNRVDLDINAESNQGLLRYCLIYEHFDLFDQLLSYVNPGNGRMLNANCGDGVYVYKGIMHIAIDNPLVTACGKNYQKQVLSLLRRGANPTPGNLYNYHASPFSLICGHKNLTILKELMFNEKLQLGDYERKIFHDSFDVVEHSDVIEIVAKGNKDNSLVIPGQRFIHCNDEVKELVRDNYRAFIAGKADRLDSPGITLSSRKRLFEVEDENEFDLEPKSQKVGKILSEKELNEQIKEKQQSGERKVLGELYSEDDNKNASLVGAEESMQYDFGDDFALSLQFSSDEEPEYENEGHIQSPNHVLSGQSAGKVLANKKEK